MLLAVFDAARAASVALLFSNMLPRGEWPYRGAQGALFLCKLGLTRGIVDGDAVRPQLEDVGGGDVCAGGPAVGAVVASVAARGLFQVCLIVGLQQCEDWQVGGVGGGDKSGVVGPQRVGVQALAEGDGRAENLILIGCGAAGPVVSL